MTIISAMTKWLDRGWKYSAAAPSNPKKRTSRFDNISERSRRSVAFIPGAFLITLGLVVVFFPRFFLLAVSAALIFFGVLLSCLAWKLIETKKRLTALVKDLEGKIQVQNFEIRAGDFKTLEENQSKKIVYH